MDSELELRLSMEDIRIEHAQTPAARREAQKLRHQVFCLERGIFAPKPGQQLDQDEFDDHARHIVLRRRRDAQLVATARIVLGSPERRADCLPMQRYCCPSLFRDFSMTKLGEISRFAISKEFRRNASGALLRLGLLRGILAVSEEIGLTHWCALMEPSLLRLLGTTGVHFAHLGDPVQAFGLRQPCIARIDTALARGKRERRSFYDLLATRAATPSRPPGRRTPAPGQPSRLSAQ